MTTNRAKKMGQSILKRLMMRAGVRQAFVFSSQGDPMWIGNDPAKPHEIELLDKAADVLVEAEKVQRKPFIVEDNQHRFSGAALEEDTDLYLVLIHGPRAGEAVLQDIREEAAEMFRPVRNAEMRRKANSGE